MKAIVWTAYGPPEVLQLREVPKPVPKDDEVLIRIHATTVTAGDCQFRALKVPLLFRVLMRMLVGFRKPKRITILGQELAGKVEAIGERVTRFKLGDPVFALTGFDLGAYAEYICLPEARGGGVLARKPDNMTYAEAAAVPLGSLEALSFLRRGSVREGDHVLINGAGGSIGTFAVQLAKYFGAKVTAVDSAQKLEMLTSIGADQVIDYTRQDFTRNGRTYDVIFDVVGKSPYSRSLRSLKRNGRYLLANPRPFQKIRGRWTSRRSDRTVVSGMASRAPENLVFVRELIEAGKLKSVIDRRYPFERTAEAHRYVETGQKKGNVVIAVVAE